MYMKNVMYKIIMGCYIVAALVLVTAPRRPHFQNYCSSRKHAEY